MNQLISHPAILFGVILVLLMLATAIGALILHRIKPIGSESREDFSIVQGAILTLLALLIGFTLSMAVGRYDQRKNLEEEEANAIGTEFLRAELLEAAEAGKVKDLLVRYLNQRVLFYQAVDDARLQEIDAATGQIQDEMWKAVRDSAHKSRDPITGLVVAGMNDVINSQGYTQAAWLNRIPVSAWSLMIAIAVFSSLMQGYGARSEHARVLLLLVLPLTVSLSLALIADIDSPRGGLIRVKPLNLTNLGASLKR